MSKAKDDYYEFKKEADLHNGGLCDKSYEYIKELEAENETSERKISVSIVVIDKMVTAYKELEEQNKEILNAIECINNTNAAYVYKWVGDLCNDILIKYAVKK